MGNNPEIHINDNCYSYYGQPDDKYRVDIFIQDGPIKEVGVNGCQIDDVIKFSKEFISKLNEKFPCGENGEAIQHLDRALVWLEARKTNRESRGVEGLNKI